MIYNNITKTTTYVELSNGENKIIMPTSSVIIVDDESNLTSVKTVGSRKTIGLVKEENE